MTGKQFDEVVRLLEKIYGEIKRIKSRLWED